MKGNEVNQFWINLPVEDVSKSRKFFKALGFEENERHSDNERMASFFLDRSKTVMMLFPKAHFLKFLGNTIVDTQKANEVFLNIDAPSRQDVDHFARQVETAGGKVFAEPTEVDGWMYLCGFTDLDGHRWGVLHMDMEKIPE